MQATTSDRQARSHWEFPSEAYALLRHPSPSPSPLSSSQIAFFVNVLEEHPRHFNNIEKDRRPRLGDFQSIYAHNGWQQPDTPPRSPRNRASEAGVWPSDNDIRTGGSPASSPPSDNADAIEYSKLEDERKSTKNINWADDKQVKSVKWADGDNDTSESKLPWVDDLINKRLLRPNHQSQRNLQDTVSILKSDVNQPMGSPPQSAQTDPHPLGPQVPSHLQSYALPSARFLLPSVLTPAVLAPPGLYLPPPSGFLIPSTIAPIILRTRAEKKQNIVNRLLSTMKLSSTEVENLNLMKHTYGGEVSADGVHIFVDGSNITINFQEVLKAARNIPRKTYLPKSGQMSFHSLTLIMERGRPVAKRVLVGSSSRADRVPLYMKSAERCGYEVSNLSRVEKLVKMERDMKRYKGTGSGYGTESGSEGANAYLKMKEQGVDELLHLKMMETLLDYEPATLILATGDAAEAEYSAGFLRMVERVLENGWKVELVAWTKGLSSAWQSTDFRHKWKGKFKSVYLDDFAEDLLADYA
jgi:hypothetical protein